MKYHSDTLGHGMVPYTNSSIVPYMVLSPRLVTTYVTSFQLYVNSRMYGRIYIFVVKHQTECYYEVVL